MAYQFLTIPVSKLLLDQSNSRIKELQPDQESAEAALAKLAGAQILAMAVDIIASGGLDPTAPLVVTPEGAPQGKYRVIDGNRRLLALRSLKDPNVLSISLPSTSQKKRIRDLSEAFQSAPIISTRCVSFDAEREASHWITLRHTGANDGAGLVGWDSDQQDRYRVRHGGSEARNPAGQIIDFVDHLYPPKADANRKIITTLDRLISTRDVRRKVGIETANKIVYSLFPAQEVMKGLRAIVEDLRSGRVNVTNLYYELDRKGYIDGFGAERLPDPETVLAERIPLSMLVADLSQAPTATQGHTASDEVSRNTQNSTHQPNPGSSSTTTAGRSSSSAPPGPTSKTTATTPEDKGKAQRSRVRPQASRPTVVPRNCALWIPRGRINAIYHELLNLSLDDFPNACAVLLRVFLELSLDHYIDEKSLIPNEGERMRAPLSKKLKQVAGALRNEGRITLQVERTITKIADASGMLNASAVTLHQYVHNHYTYPSPSELRTAWDELEPFMQALWSK